MHTKSLLGVFLFIFCGCTKGINLGPQRAEFLATAAQDECGYLQNEFGQRISWKSHIPVDFFVSKTIPEEFHQDIIEAADIWNRASGKTIIKIHLNDTEDTFSTTDQKNSIIGLTSWDEDKNTQQALTVAKYRGNLINSADIKVNLKDFAYYSKEPQNSKQIHFGSLLVHELGHTLGLKHAVMKPTVMWATLGSINIRTQLSNTDQTSVECEY